MGKSMRIKTILVLTIALLLVGIQAQAQIVKGVAKAVVALSADTTPPTMSTSAIGTNGTSWTQAFSESVTVGAGGNAGWSGSCTTAGAITLTYASGSGTSSLVYTGSPTVNSGDTCTISYTQPTHGITDLAGNDLASISSHAVTDGSTQGATLTCSVTDPFANLTNWTDKKANGFFGVSGGQLLLSTTSGAVGLLEYSAAATSTAQDFFQIQFTTISASAENEIGLFFRSANDTGSFYAVAYDTTAHAVYLERNANWAWVSSAATSIAHTFSNGDYLRVKVTGTGTSTKVYAYYSSDGSTWTLLDSDADGISWNFSIAAQRPDATYADTGKYGGISVYNDTTSNPQEYMDNYCQGDW
jgi:hypothetical protein